MNEQQIAVLQGYSEELRQRNENMVANAQLMAGKQSLFSPEETANVIDKQLNVDDIIERADHILRGHTLSPDKTGTLIYQKHQDSKMEIFNDYGVQLLLQIVCMYVQRSTLLGNYTKPEIDHKMYNIANKIRTLIYTKSDEMGLDTPEKRKLYPIVVRELIDLIHGAYMRALNGEERRTIRTQMFVTQNQNPGQPTPMMPMAPTKKAKWYNPFTWAR